MKSSLLYLCAAALPAVQAFARFADIYITGSLDGPSTGFLSPPTARLLLARRLGLSQYHSLESADGSALDTLNTFGGEQRTLLSANEPWTGLQRNLIIIEGVENPEDLPALMSHRARLAVRDPPHYSQTLQLFKDLVWQSARSPVNRKEPCAFSLQNGVEIHGGIVLGPSHANGYCPHESASAQDWRLILDDIAGAIPGRTAAVHITVPDAASSKKDPDFLQELSRQLSGLLATGSGHESTIMLISPPSRTTKPTSASSYGSYTLPNSKPLQAREAQSEELLTAPSAPETSLASHHHSIPQTLKASGVPKTGILPVCQSSLEKLIDVTGNCSGHGTPYMKHNTTSESSACYVCKCKKTVISRGEGKGVKTIEWAGPACSKKDVSMPFWLLAGISIGMVATVSWGIGLLFSIGQEDLPSVIGAGVAGPRAQK